MKTLMNTCPIIISEHHIEIAAHELHEAPSIHELADILGHDFRTVVDKSDHRFRNWVWDRLGIHCLPLATLDQDPRERVRYIFIVLNALGYDSGPRESFPGPVTVFGHRQSLNQTPNTFVRHVIASAPHLEFSPESPSSITRQRTKLLKGGGRVTFIDASLKPGVDASEQEVAICYEFSLSRITESALVPRKASDGATTAPPTPLPAPKTDGPWDVFINETLRMLTKWFWRGGWKFVLFLGLLAFLYLRYTFR